MAKQLARLESVRKHILCVIMIITRPPFRHSRTMEHQSNATTSRRPSHGERSSVTRQHVHSLRFSFPFALRMGVSCFGFIRTNRPTHNARNCRHRLHRQDVMQNSMWNVLHDGSQNIKLFSKKIHIHRHIITMMINKWHNVLLLIYFLLSRKNNEECVYAMCMRLKSNFIVVAINFLIVSHFYLYIYFHCYVSVRIVVVFVIYCVFNWEFIRGRSGRIGCRLLSGCDTAAFTIKGVCFITAVVVFAAFKWSETRLWGSLFNWLLAYCSCGWLRVVASQPYPVI